MAAKKNQQKQAARERAAAIRAQQDAKERKQRLMVAAVTSAVVLLIVVGIVAVALLNKDKPNPTAAKATKLDSASLADLNHVPSGTLDAAGAGDTTNGPKRVKDATKVTKDGKPQVLYVGAEYCPYCAGLRWSAAVALARFGTWKSLATSQSAQEGQLDPVSTVSFSQQNHGADYSSDLITFTGYETKTAETKNGEYTKLDSFGGDDKALFDKYDYKPYVDAQSEGAIPFVSIGGTTFQHGGLMQIDLLAGKSQSEIAASLKEGKEPAAKAILANANVLTAAICEQTGGKPADVCSSKGVEAAKSKITDQK